MPVPWRSVLTRMVLPSALVSVLYQRSWMWPAMWRRSSQHAAGRAAGWWLSLLSAVGVGSGCVLIGGLAFGYVGEHVGGVVTDVLADAESGRADPLPAPLVDGLFGHLEDRGDVVGGQVAVRQPAAERGAGVRLF